MLSWVRGSSRLGWSRRLCYGYGVLLGGGLGSRVEDRAVLAPFSVLANTAGRRLTTTSLESLDLSDEPGGLARALPRPVLLQVVLARLDAPAAHVDDEANKAVQDGVDEDAAMRSGELPARLLGSLDLRDETIGDAVAERDERHDDKGREDIADVSPVDLRDLSNHHAADLGTLV